MRPRRPFGVSLSDLKHAALVVAMVAVIVAGMFYGMMGEQDLKEFKYSDGWWTWQHERALAEWKAEKIAKSGERKSKRVKEYKPYALRPTPYANK